MTPPLPVLFAAASRLAVLEGSAAVPPAGTAWALRGTTSNTRYTMRAELDGLAARQEGLGRHAARRAVLIPIRRSAALWELAHDERRAIFEERSRHIVVGMDTLPAVARRLRHCRELGEGFDFLTWFEFAPADVPAFDAMLQRPRATAEWRYLDREVEVRLSRA